MEELMDLILQLDKDIDYISNFIDENISYIDEAKVDLLNANTESFLVFLAAHSERNLQFQEKIKSLGISSLTEGIENGIFSDDNFKNTVNDFQRKMVTTNKKFSEYKKLVGSQYNMMNKIKHFKTKSRLDLNI